MRSISEFSCYPVTVISPVLHIHSFIIDANISQQLTTSLEKNSPRFPPSELKSNFVELAPGKREDLHLKWHYGVRIPNNRPMDVNTMQLSRFFFLSFQRNTWPSISVYLIYFRWMLKWFGEKNLWVGQGDLKDLGKSALRKGKCIYDWQKSLKYDYAIDVNWTNKSVYSDDGGSALLQNSELSQCPIK